MYNVTKEQFYNYVESNDFKPTQGWSFHSTNYVDRDGVVKATVTSSSWGAPTHYRIADEGFANMETLMFVNLKLEEEMWKLENELDIPFSQRYFKTKE